VTQKERIVNAAFAAWGDTHFTDTSLAQVSSRLGVTKQALYRHLSGKEQLLAEMETQFAEDLDRVIEEFETRAAPRSLEDSLPAYIDLLFGFFGEHPYYYLYLTLHLARFPDGDGRRFREVRDRHRRVLGELLRRAGYTDEAQINMGVHFLSTTGFVWMASCFWTEDGHRREVSRAGAEMDARRELAARIVMRGLFPDAADDGADGVPFEQIEAEAGVEADELPERNHILNAIAAVVTERGFEQATVERIAERAGMSKSSLYFHFRNRAEMMASMLIPERARLIELVESRTARYREFASQLYAFMVVTATYAARSRSILTALDWMRFHRIRVQLDGEIQRGPVHTFLAGRLAGPDYEHAGLTEVEVLAYLTHLIMRPVLEQSSEEPATAPAIPQSIFRSIRLLYPFVVGGLVEKEYAG
jgi:AcrR family transcriptional regulator